MNKANKVTILGCGKVGMSIAYSLAHRGNIQELVLFGRNRETLIGEKLDIEHGLSFLSHMTVTVSDDYQDMAGSDVVIMSAGASQKPGQTRLELTQENLAIIDTVIPNIVAHAPEAIILIVTNPVDILTYRAYKVAGLPKGQILGSGTTLDTARFRFHLSEFLHINPRSIHTYILGEHGDHSFPVISSASVGGQPLTTMEQYSEEKMMRAYESARTAAYKIIQTKGASFYAIGSVVSYIVSVIVQNTRSVLPVSIPLHGQYDLSGVALSVPCIIGKTGVERILETNLSTHEKKQLHAAGDVLKGFL